MLTNASESLADFNLHVKGWNRRGSRRLPLRLLGCISETPSLPGLDVQLEGPVNLIDATHHSCTFNGTSELSTRVLTLAPTRICLLLIVSKGFFFLSRTPAPIPRQTQRDGNDSADPQARRAQRYARGRQEVEKRVSSS